MTSLELVSLISSSSSSCSFSSSSADSSSVDLSTSKTSLLGKDYFLLIEIDQKSTKKMTDLTLKGIKEYNRRPLEGSREELLKQLGLELQKAQKYLDISILPLTFWNKADPALYMGVCKQIAIKDGGGAAQLLGSRPRQEDFYVAQRVRLNDRRYEHYALYDGHSGRTCAQYLSEESLKYFERAFIEKEELDEIAMMKILKVGYVHLSENYRTHFIETTKPFIETTKPSFCCFSDCLLQDFLKPIPHGSTALSCFIDLKMQRIWICNVGDCRAILVLENGKVIALTNDANLSKEEFTKGVKLRGGKIDGSSGYIVYKTQGIDKRIALPRAVGHPASSGIHARSRITSISFSDLPEGEHTLFMGTDGVWDVVSSRSLADYIHQLKVKKLSLEIIAGMVVKRCYMSDPVRADNITAMAIPISIKNSH